MGVVIAVLSVSPLFGGLQARESLEGLFRAAEGDPAAVVPLVLGVSEEIGRVDGDRGHELAERLEPFCRRVFLGPERVPGMERLGLGLHTVQAGEVPVRIAGRYGIGAGLLGHLNEGFEPRRLREGQRLKVLDLSGGGLQVVVDRGRFRAGVWQSRPGAEGWVLVMYAPVGVGAPETPTPLGRTKVVQRVLEPEWTHPVTREVFAPTDPGNVLGGYWMALDPEGIGKSGIGFHGYTAEAPERWLERPASNGCVRLRQHDMDALFHLALEGTPVAIAP